MALHEPEAGRIKANEIPLIIIRKLLKTREEVKDEEARLHRKREEYRNFIVGLSVFYTDTSIARALGVSRQRVRSIIDGR